MRSFLGFSKAVARGKLKDAALKKLWCVKPPNLTQWPYLSDAMFLGKMHARLSFSTFFCAKGGYTCRDSPWRSSPHSPSSLYLRMYMISMNRLGGSVKPRGEQSC